MGAIGVGRVNIGVGTGGHCAPVGMEEVVRASLSLAVPKTLLAEPVGARLSCGLGIKSPSVGLLWAPPTHHEDQRARFLDVTCTDGLVILQRLAFMMVALEFRATVATVKWKSRYLNQ